MASEAEFERLYQLFIANGGGNLTFSGSNLTPKQYSEAVSSSNLTPLQMAQLEAKQHQYNRQSALNTIANEVEANNFSNPYAARGVYGNSLLSALGGHQGSINAGLINGAFGTGGFTDANRAEIVAEVLSATGVDLEKLIKIAGITGLGTAMYTSLTDHTNNQTANIPQAMEDASSLSAMNEQFGEQGDPCSFFNQLMGILAGIYDGTLDFIEKGIGDITSFLNKTGISALLASIVSAISGAIGGVATAVGAVIALLVGAGLEVLKALMPIIGKVINAIGDITTAIASEINALADMAAELLKKALALLIGSAASDPCKKKVLENTGTPEMKDAIAKLNHPLGSGPPHMIGTTTDTRANAENVLRAMTNAKENALIDDGVPQSPFTETAQYYSPYDSTLHAGATDTPYFTGGVETEAKRDYWTRKILSKQYTDLNRVWMPLQKDYIIKASNLISQMRKGLSGEKNEYSSHINSLITNLQTYVEDIKLLRTNVRHHFTYVTKNVNVYDKIDNANERKIANFYQTSIKRTMQRKLDMAEQYYRTAQTSWNSIANNLYY